MRGCMPRKRHGFDRFDALRAERLIPSTSQIRVAFAGGRIDQGLDPTETHDLVALSPQYWQNRRPES